MCRFNITRYCVFKSGFRYLDQFILLQGVKKLVSYTGFSHGSDGKGSACNAGDLGSIPGLGRSPGGRHGNLFQDSAWEIPWAEEPGRLQSMGLQSDMTE